MSNIFNITLSKNKKLESIYEESIDNLNHFFSINWAVNKPKICIVDNRATINALKDQETPKWLVGWNMDRTVYVLNEDSFSTDSDHKYSEDDYKMLIKHELAHSYFKIVTGGKTQPNWLWEGISILASGQAEVWKKPVEFKSFLDNKDVYAESGYALLLLSEKYGKDKLLQTLKKYKTFQGDFSNLFQEEFEAELNYDFFNKLIKNNWVPMRLIYL